jgi:hypothetical protein
VLAELKDQGDFALTTMERLIRQGNDVSNCGAAGSARVTVRYVDGMFIYLRVSGGKFQQSNDNVTWRDISSSNVTVTNTLPFKCADNYDGFNPDVVNVGFTLRHVSTGTQESFLGTISLRNVSTD